MGMYLAPRLKRFYLEQKLTTKDKQALMVYYDDIGRN